MQSDSLVHCVLSRVHYKIRLSDLLLDLRIGFSWCIHISNDVTDHALHSECHSDLLHAILPSSKL